MVTKNVLMTILHKILESIDEGVHVIDGNGFTILYNKAMAELEGMTIEEVMGQKFLNMFPDLDSESSTLLNVLKTEKPILNQSQVYLNKQKKRITTINSTIPLYYDDEIIGAVEIARNITKIKELSDEIMRLQQSLTNPVSTQKKNKITFYTFESLKGSSPNFLKALRMAQKAAKSSSSVLVFGETGTGKELFVQGIHYDSERKSQPFIAQNCAAFPESLLEGILFGTSKGSFTGAIDRPGIFEQANGGTILLDEINSMGKNLQAKLLRVLQEGYVRRVGGLKDIPVDVRIIATTNEAPEDLLYHNIIRKDLFYRLNVINIVIPPLRERKEDIELLANYFIEKHNSILNKCIQRIEKGCMEAFLQYGWPGNIRELENAIEGAMNLTLSEDELSKEDFPEYLFRETEKNFAEKQNSLHFDVGEGMPLNELVEKIEFTYIKKALATTNGNISQAAKKLGIKRQTLQHKIKKIRV
ncbi:sigma-54 interaction domain-containing protein [Tindallia californiensis]|uniref:Arginine utilization regulatory protein n=1 Tax=Tindallia californiensis TaxID=159292 RepID=A0A1H3NF80_9FIRM|nr:sigma 54-interacting transcriptional regulator [Tindallia californiensis]SDY87601.1 arginine utilization regulatory protein [Tindallia californiensis]